MSTSKTMYSSICKLGLRSPIAANSINVSTLTCRYSGASILLSKCSTRKAKFFSPGVISARITSLSKRLRRSNLSPITTPLQCLNKRQTHLKKSGGTRFIEPSQWRCCCQPPAGKKASSCDSGSTIHSISLSGCLTCKDSRWRNS